ncbi:hypothetical protein PAAL109150_11050 [Paenibacillus alkaliterrae]
MTVQFSNKARFHPFGTRFKLVVRAVELSLRDAIPPSAVCTLGLEVTNDY